MADYDKTQLAFKIRSTRILHYNKSHIPTLRLASRKSPRPNKCTSPKFPGNIPEPFRDFPPPLGASSSEGRERSAREKRAPIVFLVVKPNAVETVSFLALLKAFSSLSAAGKG